MSREESSGSSDELTRGENTGTQDFEDALASSPQDRYIFQLFVTGTTPRSIRAIRNLREMCESHLKGRYDLQVVDIYQNPEHARSGHIVVTPTLVKTMPLPIRRLIGDLSNADRVLISLDIVPSLSDAPEGGVSTQTSGKAGSTPPEA